MIFKKSFRECLMLANKKAIRRDNKCFELIKSFGFFIELIILGCMYFGSFILFVLIFINLEKIGISSLVLQLPISFIATIGLFYLINATLNCFAILREVPCDDGEE